MDLAWVYNVTNMNVLVADNLPCKYLVASSLNACFPYQLTHMCTPQGSKFYCFRNSTRSKRNIVTFVQSQCLCKPVYSVLPVHISLQFLSMQTSLQRFACANQFTVFACTHQFTAFCLCTPVYSVLPVHTSLQHFACAHQFTAFCLYTPVYSVLPVHTSLHLFAWNINGLTVWVLECQFLSISWDKTDWSAIALSLHNSVNKLLL